MKKSVKVVGLILFHLRFLKKTLLSYIWFHLSLYHVQMILIFLYLKVLSPPSLLPPPTRLLKKQLGELRP